MDRECKMKIYRRKAQLKHSGENNSSPDFYRVIVDEDANFSNLSEMKDL